MSQDRFVIYHNPRCTKSREALDRLQKRGVQLKIVEYLKTPLSVEDLDQLLKLMKLDPSAIVRKSEDRFFDLELDSNPPRTRKAWLKILADNPVLVERPIVSNGRRAALGRPPEKVEIFFTEEKKQKKIN